MFPPLKMRFCVVSTLLLLPFATAGDPVTVTGGFPAVQAAMQQHNETTAYVNATDTAVPEQKKLPAPKNVSGPTFDLAPKNASGILSKLDHGITYVDHAITGLFEKLAYWFGPLGNCWGMLTSAARETLGKWNKALIAADKDLLRRFNGTIGPIRISCLADLSPTDRFARGFLVGSISTLITRPASYVFCKIPGLPGFIANFPWRGSWYLLSGLVSAYIAYGLPIVFHFFTTCITLMTLVLIKGGKGSDTNAPGFIALYFSAFQFLFFSFLRMGTQTPENDMDVCTGQMLLCLRHIGIVYDHLDAVTLGHQGCLTNKRYNAYEFGFGDLLDLWGYTFAPFIYLVGPIIPFREYVALARGDHLVSFEWDQVAKTVVVGLSGYVLYSLSLKVRDERGGDGDYWFDLSKLRDENFLKTQSPFRLALWYYPMTSMLIMMRYIAVWCFAEAIGTLSGLQFKHRVLSVYYRFKRNHEPFSPDNPVVVTNMFPWQNLMGSTVNEIMNTWNINVNAFVEYYIIARIGQAKTDEMEVLKDTIDEESPALDAPGGSAMYSLPFSKNKPWNNHKGAIYAQSGRSKYSSLSMPLMAAFLAFWHGTYSGYFLLFGFEAVTQTLEKVTNAEWALVLRDYFFEKAEKGSGGAVFYVAGTLVYIIQTLSIRFVLSNLALGYMLLSASDWWKAMRPIRFAPIIWYFIFYPILGLITIPITPLLKKKPVVDSGDSGGLVKKPKSTALNFDHPPKGMDRASVLAMHLSKRFKLRKELLGKSKLM